MAKIRNYNKTHRPEDKVKSPRNLARVRDMDYRDLYFDSYPKSYQGTMRGTKPNRRMNGRPMGICTSCSNTRRRR